MLNMAGSADGLEQELNKSAFMEIQQQQMAAQRGMGAYHIQSAYPGQQSHMDSFSNQPRPPLGYPFPTMNSMAPHSTYNTYPFSSPAYQTSVTPSVTSPTSRDGESNTYVIVQLPVFFAIHSSNPVPLSLEGQPSISQGLVLFTVMLEKWHTTLKLHILQYIQSS